MNKKLLVSSLSVIVACASIVAGSTYALFTSESKVNVAVTSGTVDVVATAKNFVVKSGQWNDTTSSYDIVPTGSDFFTNGGYVDYSDGHSIKLERMSAMDYVTFDIEVENRSDIKIKYQTKLFVKTDNGLFDELEVTTTINNATEDYSGKEIVSSWVELDVDADPETITLTLGLPEGSNAQNKSCEIEYAVYAVQGNAHTVDPVVVWDGTNDTSWYNDTDTEFTLNNPAQIVGLSDLVDGGNTFAGKTIKLDSDMDLYKLDDNGEPISFEPIGTFSDNEAFQGTFDGQGHTISNMYQNGWALANGYWDGPEYGMGFFSLVENATIKNINFDGASLPSEANIMGVVAGGAANCTLENINVTNSYLGNHSWYSGGLLGWAEGNITINKCTIDETSSVSSQWGDFNNANGGLIGGIDPAGTYKIENCEVACVIDAYNDVTSAYEWYSYRSCGMLIGDTGQMDDPDGNNVGNAIAPNLTCENVKVIYGDWANYHYCQFSSSNYPYCRVEAGESTGAYGNARVGEYFDANGNKVVDDNHVHNDGEKHNELIVFDQLYGGQSGDRYCTYGTATHPGVTVVYNNI